MTQLEGVTKKLRQDQIFEHIAEERDRQDQKHPMPNGFPPTDRLAILVEEVGEVGKALCEHKKLEVRKELIHVAAVAVRWLELIDEEAISEIRKMNESGISPELEELELYRAAIRRRTL